MRELSAAAAEVLPDGSPWLSMSCLMDGVAALALGETAFARESLSEGARRAAVFGAPVVQTICLADWPCVAADEDDWHVARMLSSQARAQVERSGLGDYPTMAIVLAAAAFVRAHDGQSREGVRGPSGGPSTARGARRLRQLVRGRDADRLRPRRRQAG